MDWAAVRNQARSVPALTSLSMELGLKLLAIQQKVSIDKTERVKKCQEHLGTLLPSPHCLLFCDKAIRVPASPVKRLWAVAVKK